jgi:predicted alpha/beta hydrolase family esterase
MPTQVLFVQGGGEGAHHEDAKLASSLAKELGPNYSVHYPEMPDEDDPDVEAWSNCVRQALEAIGEGSVLVAHSLGAPVAVRVAAETNLAIEGLFLVAAPWVGPGGWEGDFAPPPDFPARLAKIPVYLYHGTDDEIAPFAHLDLYAGALPHATVRRLKGRTHQLDDDLSEVAADIKRLTRETR